jgi:hypothetical protein
MKITIVFNTSVILLLMVFLFSFIVIVPNQNYVTPLTDVSINSKNPPAQSSEPIQSQPKINPDGTKNFTVDLSCPISVTWEIGGSYFSSSKFTAFTFGTILQEISMEIIEQLAEHVRDIVMLTVIFLALITMPLILCRRYARSDNHS